MWKHVASREGWEAPAATGVEGAQPPETRGSFSLGDLIQTEALSIKHTPSLDDARLYFCIDSSEDLQVRSGKENQ